MKEDQGYTNYLVLHLMECDGFFNDETCDERWSNASAHLKIFMQSKYNDSSKSTYECIEEYVKSYNA